MRNSTCIAIVISLEVSILGGLADYLPIAGPRPLRFAEPAVVPNLTQLPPLPMDDRPVRDHDQGKDPAKEDTAVSDTDVQKPSLADTSANNLGAGNQPVVNLPPEIITTIRSNNNQENQNQGLPLSGFENSREPLLSPQMLVPFFQPSLGTNRLPVTLPLIFAPASPPALPSSSATYEKR